MMAIPFLPIAGKLAAAFGPSVLGWLLNRGTGKKIESIADAQMSILLGQDAAARGNLALDLPYKSNLYDALIQRSMQSAPTYRPGATNLFNPYANMQQVGSARDASGRMQLTKPAALQLMGAQQMMAPQRLANPARVVPDLQSPEDLAGAADFLGLNDTEGEVDPGSYAEWVRRRTAPVGTPKGPANLPDPATGRAPYDVTKRPDQPRFPRQLR